MCFSYSKRWLFWNSQKKMIYVGERENNLFFWTWTLSRVFFFFKGWIHGLCIFQACSLGLTYVVPLLLKKKKRSMLWQVTEKNRIDPWQEYFRTSSLTSLVVKAKNPPAFKDEIEIKPQRTFLYPFGIKIRYSLVRELENVE